MARALSYITLIAVCCLVLFFTLNKKLEKKSTIIFKVVSLVLAAIFTIRYLWDNDAVENMFKLTSNIFDNKFINLIAITIVWLTYSSNLILILYGFFKVRLLNKFVYFLAVPISVINLFIFPIHIKAIMGANALASVSVRSLLLAAEIGLSLAYA